MASHVKVVAILHIVFGALGILAALIVLAVFGGIAGVVGATNATHHDPDAWIAIPILGGIGAFLFLLILVISLPGVIAGWGLLQFRPWARILTIVISCLDLLHVPFGTALGVYGLWVLLSNEGEALFARRPAAVLQR